MNETQKRIKAYKEALPGLKERVVAVALLLAMSMAMMTSATFAWITLSRAPEVSNVTTNIAANGNLEIALVKPDGSQPDESAVGDSSAADGRNIVDANLTWGNLVNLSDPSYGLSDIVLRPALLGNTDDLVSQPLKGVDYGMDGRLEQYYNEDYQFANYIINQDGTSFFKYNDPQQYGVRAISTVEYTYVNNDYYQFTQMIVKPTSVQSLVVDDYAKMIGTKKNTDVLASLITVFLDDEMNGSGQGTANATAYVPDAYALATEFEGIVNDFGDALFELANVQIYNHYGSKNYENNLYANTEEFFADRANWTTKGIQIDCIDEYLAIKNTIHEVVHGKNPETRDCMADFYAYVDPEQGGSSSNVVTIKELMDVMDKLVNINTSQIYLKGLADPFTVTTLSDFVFGLIAEKGTISGGMELLGYIGDVRVVILDGTLKDFEQLTGAKMDAQIEVTASYKGISLPIKAKSITCSVDRANILFNKDIDTTTEVAANNKGDYTGVAQDTYGLAMDYWVRTNAANSYLVLEGNVLTKTENVRAVTKDKNGADAELFTAKVTTTLTDESGQTQSFEDTVEVYVLDEKDDADGMVKEAIYNAYTHMRIAFGGVATMEGQTISSLTPLMKEKVTVIGYEGENRIWNADDDIFMTTDSTTQGNGSCYVFYAEDVAQQENSLRLLSNLRVAFVDNNKDSETYGKLVGLAKLDTENPYEENGKVILPLVLYDDGSDSLTKTGNDGELAIMKLEQNEATQILTLVYLDGRDISNADVFAAGDIQGQLNIQFGSTMELEPIDDEELASQTRTITAVAKKSTAAEYGSTADPITFDFDTETNPMSVDVKVTVEGDSPTNVSAIIMRQVNATQGSIEKVLPLTESNTEPGVYEGTYTFTAPGNYIIRTVRLDGMDYSLPADSDPATNKEYPRVEISGFGVEFVNVDYEGVNVGTGVKKILSDKKTVSANVAVKFATGQDKFPRSVQLQFVKEAVGGDTLVTANMGYNNTTGIWSGTANFTASGEYVLKYIIMDGQYDELPETNQATLDITLGLKVRVRDTDAALRDKIWEGDPYSIPIIVEVLDEGNNSVPHLDVALKYGTSATSVDSVDPPLKWNATKNYYEGHLWIGTPGIHKFIAVVVNGKDELKSTTNVPPEFKCTSTDPVAFLDAEPTAEAKGAVSLGTLDFEFTSATKYKTGVRLVNASTANLSAVFFNEEDQTEYTVVAEGEPGKSDGRPVATYKDAETEELISEFVFEIPTVPNKPSQAGKWTLRRLILTGVTDQETDESGYHIYHGEDNPLTIQMTSTNDNDLKVRIVKVNVESLYDGKNSTSTVEFTGRGLLERVDTSALTIKITDHNGAKIADADTVSLQYMLVDKSWETYGGYTSAQLNEAATGGYAEVKTYTPVPSNDGSTFTTNSVTLTYAGKYVPVLTFKVNGQEFTYKDQPVLDVGVPQFILQTETPTIELHSTNPTKGESYKTLGADGNEMNANVTVEGRNIRIFPEAAVETGCNAKVTIVRQATVALKLTGLGSATRATLKFNCLTGSTVYMYPLTESGEKGDKQTDSYEWTSGSDVVTRVIGNYFDAGCSNMSSIKNAGELESNNYITFELNNGNTTISVNVAIDPFYINQAPEA